MPFKSRFWADLTTRDFAALDADHTVAVLPLAATEQHGPHLPLRVDQTLADGVIAAALPRLPAGLPVLFLPTQAVGYSPEHAAFAGTLSLSFETVTRTWIELGECVARAGVKKLVLFNAHGGQVSLMDVVARELRSRCGLIVFGTSWFSLPLGDAVLGQFSAHEHRFGVHAGEIETAMMLSLLPQWVEMRHAQDFRSVAETRAAQFAILGNGRSAKLGWAMQDYNTAGAAGNAAAATADKGHNVVEAAGQQLALLLQEVSQLPLSTVLAR